MVSVKGRPLMNDSLAPGDPIGDAEEANTDDGTFAIGPLEETTGTGAGDGAISKTSIGSSIVSTVKMERGTKSITTLITRGESVRSPE